MLFDMANYGDVKRIREGMTAQGETWMDLSRRFITNPSCEIYYGNSLEVEVDSANVKLLEHCYKRGMKVMASRPAGFHANFRAESKWLLIHVDASHTSPNPTN